MYHAKVKQVIVVYLSSPIHTPSFSTGRQPFIGLASFSVHADSTINTIAPRVLCGPLFVMNNYETAKWKKKRAAILRRDKYICQESKRYGRIIQADTVHHIFPVEQYPEYMYCDWNLISLCHAQHNAMHDRDTHQLSAKGRELMERTARAITPPLSPLRG